MRKEFASIVLEIIKVPFNRSCFIVLLLLAVSVKVQAQQNIPRSAVERHRIVVAHEGQKLALSIDCPFFKIDDQTIGGYAPLAKQGDINKSVNEPLRISYAPVMLVGGGKMDIQLFVRWFPEEKLFRKWARYKLSGVNHPVLIREIILDKIDADLLSITQVPVPGQSYPVFLRGFYIAIEYPVSSMRMDAAGVVLAHEPGIHIQPGKWYESRKAIYGTAKPGREKQAFLSYVSYNRQPGTDSIHVNYNSWWTAPIVYSEQDILDLEKTFEEKMFAPYKVSLNTFCLDMGWSNPHSIWQIDTTLFPKKFTSVGKAAKRMNTNLGLWISPSNMYSPNSIETKWAKEQGYETFKWRGNHEFLCLAGRRYSIAFREQLLDMVKKYQLKQLKFDGYIFDCQETNHGHEPGSLSVEPIAESLIETCRQIHAASKDTWIEMTCMGPNPSPWWVFYANSTLGTFGDDSPAGRVPSPEFRESYTSSRDFSNLQGATYLMMPISSQEILGIIHQTPEAFTNDAVTTVMRGHAYLPLYVNPKYMDPARWKQLAAIISWAKKNDVIKNTTVLLPESWKRDSVPKFSGDASMPRESYGYAHCDKTKGLILLRNPWIANGRYVVKIDSVFGFSKAVRSVNIVSLYPEVRTYAKDLQYGDTITIPLAPYETLLLSVSQHALLKGLPAGDSLRGFGQVVIDKVEKTTKLAGNVSSGDSAQQRRDGLLATTLSMQGSVEVVAPSAELLILVEGDTLAPKGTISVNGKLAEPIVTGTAQGWTATQYKTPERWVFLRVPLQKGKNLISLRLDLPATSQKASVWAWGKKSGGAAQNNYPNVLPQPEVISLESVALVDSFDTHL